MPATKRPKPIYQRGEFRLFRRPDRGLEIVWYDKRRKRERSRSAGSTDEGRARLALDNLYVETHGGVPVCPTCHRPLEQRGEAIAVLVANYLETKDAKDAVHPRLAHVVDFLEATDRIDDRADQADEEWATAFRKWMAARTDRPRSPSTIENSLIQLAAALRLGGVRPGFRPIPTREVNRVLSYRADVAQLAGMFRWCLYPQARSPKARDRRRRERENLLRYLRAAVATWARPDALMDIDTRRERGQWHGAARVLALNPTGRRQTRKRRATVPIARQFAPHLNATIGPYIPVNSVKSAWESMATDLALPRDGESGTKLIRRSVMTIARARLGEEHWVQGRMMAGHVPVTVSDLYALFDPANLGRALAVTEAIIDEIEVLCPGAYRAFTAAAAIATAAAQKKSPAKRLA